MAIAPTKVTPFGGAVFDKDDLLKLDEDLLRALLRERTHHNIEVPLYTVLANGQKQAVPIFGLQAQMVYDAWVERGLPVTDPDFEWVKDNLEIAAKIRSGEKVEWELPLPEPFTEEGRRSHSRPPTGTSGTRCRSWPLTTTTTRRHSPRSRAARARPRRPGLRP